MLGSNLDERFKTVHFKIEGTDFYQGLRDIVFRDFVSHAKDLIEKNYVVPRDDIFFIMSRHISNNLFGYNNAIVLTFENGSLSKQWRVLIKVTR